MYNRAALVFLFCQKYFCLVFIIIVLSIWRIVPRKLILNGISYNEFYTWLFTILKYVLSNDTYKVDLVISSRR